MEARIKNFCKTSIPFREKGTVNLDGYTKFGGDKIYDLFDYNLRIANEGVINKVVISGTISKYFQFNEFLSEEEEEEEYKLQGAGEYPANIGIDGFEQKKSLKFFVVTNKQISSIYIPLIPTEFIFEYKPEIKDYFPELKEELESLCRMIMLEKDEKLTIEAITLKKSLIKYFRKNMVSSQKVRGTGEK